MEELHCNQVPSHTVKAIAGMGVHLSNPLSKRLLQGPQLSTILLAIVCIHAAFCAARRHPLSGVHEGDSGLSLTEICPWTVGIYTTRPPILQCLEPNTQPGQRDSDRVKNGEDGGEYASHKLAACVSTHNHPDPTTGRSDDVSGEVGGSLEAHSIPSYADWKDLMGSRASSEVAPTYQRISVNFGHLNDNDAGIERLSDDGEIYLNIGGGPEHARGPGSGRVDQTISKGTPAEPTQTEAPNGAPNGSDELDAGAVDSHESDALLYDDGRTQYYRSKDAGKTCKERFSYSSFDAGATVLKSSRGAKNAKAILVENKDTYMLMECADDSKYIIIELSDDILVDTVVLANFEFFSSMIRHFRVSVSDRYPVKMDKWKDLGTFEAKNSRDIQSFLVDNPHIWAKYIRVEFLSHFGNEYYCPLSLVRIHGTRMMESWQDVERGEDEGDSDGEIQLESLPQSITNDLGRAVNQDYIDGRFIADEPSSIQLPQSEPDAFVDMCRKERQEWLFGGGVLAPDMCLAHKCPMKATMTMPYGPHVGFSGDVQQPPYAGRLESESTILTTIDHFKAPASSLARTPIPRPDQEPDVKSTPRPTSCLTGEANHTPRVADSTVTSISIAMAGSSKGKTAAASGATPALPIVQESFFKSITKRLQVLETNMTSSLKYLEDQSRHINDILYSSEKRLVTKMESFIRDMNRTLQVDVRRLHQEYNEIYQLTTVALDRQREQSGREIVALSSRLNLLADEVIFQKRMAIAQAVLLLSCLVLVIFTTGISSPQHKPTGAHFSGACDLKTTTGPALVRSWGGNIPSPSAYRDGDAHPYSPVLAVATEYGSSTLAASHNTSVEFGPANTFNEFPHPYSPEPFKHDKQQFCPRTLPATAMLSGQSHGPFTHEECLSD